MVKASFLACLSDGRPPLMPGSGSGSDPGSMFRSMVHPHIHALSQPFTLVHTCPQASAASQKAPMASRLKKPAAAQQQQQQQRTSVNSTSAGGGVNTGDLLVVSKRSVSFAPLPPSLAMSNPLILIGSIILGGPDREDDDDDDVAGGSDDDCVNESSVGGRRHSSSSSSRRGHEDCVVVGAAAGSSGPQPVAAGSSGNPPAASVARQPTGVTVGVTAGVTNKKDKLKGRFSRLLSK